jgi:hypothetical protein
MQAGELVRSLVSNDPPSGSLIKRAAELIFVEILKLRERFFRCMRIEDRHRMHNLTPIRTNHMEGHTRLRPQEPMS